MHAIGTQSSSTMFLLCSPQHLADDGDIRTALIECHAHRTLCMVAIDETHLYTMHGHTFRECIRVLHDVFFETIFADGEWHPLFWMMTATMTLDLVESLSIFTCVEWEKTIQTFNWPRAVHQMGASAWDFR